METCKGKGGEAVLSGSTGPPADPTPKPSDSVLRDRSPTGVFLDSALGCLSQTPSLVGGPVCWELSRHL